MAVFSARDLHQAEIPHLPADNQRPASGLAETKLETQGAPLLSPVVLQGIVRTVEFLLIVATGILVHQLYIAPTHGLELQYFIAIPLVALLTMVVFQVLGATRIAAFRMPVRYGPRVFGGWSLVFVIALAIVFFARLGDAFSRVWLFSWYATGLTVLAIERGLLYHFINRLTRAGRLERRTVIVGGGPAGERLLKDLAMQDHSDLRIYGVFDDRTDERSPDVVAGYPKLGTVDDLVDFARHVRIDLVIFTLPITAEQRLLQMLRKLWVLPVDIRLSAHMNKLRFRPRAYSYIGNVPVFDLFDKPMADWDIILKALFDRIVGGLCLIALAPIMLLVALAVKLDSKGPILFKQKRYGFNNEIIEVFKFRSMYVEQQDLGAKKLVTRNDPRVTRVGRFIRKTSLDELPQLFNVVFQGNLSLVGPRPHAMHATAAERQYDEVVDGYFARHRVRPGITGWAQIHGWRGETDTADKIQNRVDYDLYYIENWSILLDLYILMITPFALFKTENAY
jgi:Undecaprenyl-phosphate glucose phosphotransferase